MAGPVADHPRVPQNPPGKASMPRPAAGHDEPQFESYGGSMLATTLALALHILAAVVWVGGMFAAYVCLRPAASALEGPHRFVLWRDFFAKFFPWVWVTVILLLASGYWMLLTTFGGFAGAPLYVNLMQAIGWVMVLLYAWLFHGPWLAFKRAVAAQNWAAAAPQLNRIRQIIMVNLPLGLIVVVIGGTGRFWVL
jgi:uncharacterized membrane protein